MLDAIGAIFKTEAQKAVKRPLLEAETTQDPTTVPLSRTHDDNTAAQEDVDPQDILVSLSPDMPGNTILPVVEKVGHLFLTLY